MSVQRIHVSPDSECHDSILRNKCIKFAYAKRQHMLVLPLHFVATVVYLCMEKADKNTICEMVVLYCSGLVGVTGLGQLLVLILLSVQIHMG